MNWIDNLSNFLTLSTPVISEDLGKLLSDKKFSDDLIKAIHNERSNFSESRDSDLSNELENSIKRVGLKSY